MKRFVSLFVIFLIAGRLSAQDTLPHFSLVERGNKVIISWVNPYGEHLIQLNVQRSFDSLKYYSTIYSATSPQLQQNGFSDTKMPTNRVFYRVFYVLQGGSYFFSEAKRAGDASAVSATENRSSNVSNMSINDNRIVTIKFKNSYSTEMPGYSFKAFRDSILKQTKDTLLAVNDSLVLLNPYISKEVWRPSIFVYVNKDGYLNLSLPAVNDRRYRVKFFEENGTPLFEVNHIKDSPLIIDKSNFIHAGWFQFELYEDDKLKEKNKFYLPKEF